MALLKNPLHQYKSYNYRWSFGVIAAGELQNPSTYKDTGGNLVIIQSGGLPNKPVKTDIENKLGINLEFFIDDINIESLISPNPTTGVSSAISIDFTVTEPYSIGLFFQSLVVGAEMGGYTKNSYLEAPFFLTCDFVGWTPDSDTPVIVEKRTLVIKLIDCKFKVDSGGTVYNISAIPYNHIAFTDEVQNIRTNVEMYGLTVASKLNNLCETLNRQELEKVVLNQKKVEDEYVIRFPDPNEGTTSGYGKSNDIVSSFISMGAVTSAVSGGTNYIGSSTIIKDFSELGKNLFGLEAVSMDDQTVQFENFAVDKSSRVFYFNEGSKIEQIINDVILTSTWGQGLLERQPDAKGMVDWFRIDAKLEIISTEEMQNSGKPAFRYIYDVIPWKIHSSKFQEPSTPYNYVPNINDCVKAYYYSYTGKNTDIIDFEFFVNSAFFKPFVNLQSGIDSNTAYVVAPNRDRQDFDVSSGPGFESKGRSGPQQKIAPITQETTRTAGAGIDTNEMRTANLFNLLVLNSDVDNVELKLRIWGDPYYLADSDAGNYRAGPAGQYINSDKTIDYQRSEIDVLLSFNSGIDYAKNNLMPIDPVVAFNGLYRVINLVSTFSKGQFTQELTLLRRPNQQTETVEVSNSLVQAFSSNLDTSAITDAIDVLSEDVQSAFNSLIKGKPEEFLKFTRIGQLNLAGIEKLLGTQVFQLFGQAQDLIETGQKIQSNIKQALSVLQNPQGSLTELSQNIGQQLKNPVTALQGAFQEFEGFVNNPAIAESQINKNGSIAPPKNIQPSKFTPGDPTKFGIQ